MKKLILSLVLFLAVSHFTAFIIGYVAAGPTAPVVTQESCNCKLEESAAVKGCEIAAFQVYRLLQECEWKLSRTEEMVQEYCEKLFRER